MTRAAEDAILWPLEQDDAPCPAPDESVLYAGARMAPGLRELARPGRWHFVQSFKPWADALTQNSLPATSDWPKQGGHAIALIVATKQREETQGYLARAALDLREGGWFVCAGANDAGGRRLEEDCAALGLRGETHSKYHARIIRAQKKPELFHPEIAQAWMETAALHPCPATGFVSCPGLFSWDRIDPGSVLLAAHLPGDLAGTGADFGCGYGYLSLRVLEKNPGVRRLYCMDADARAVAACRANLKQFGSVPEFDWIDLTSGTGPAKNCDWIVMNPPFHEGKMARTGAGAGFIRSAATALHKGGRLYMVANSRLPYEDALAESFAAAGKLYEGQGYKIYCATK